jgi:RecB family exonuclease
MVLRLFDSPTGALDAATWSRARRVRPIGEAEWREIGVGLPSASWPETAPRSTFVDELQNLLKSSGVVDRAARWPREAAAIQAFVDGVRQLPDLDRSTSFAAFRAEVDELLSVLMVAASPGHGGVELHTPLSLFGARVDHVFVVGAAEGQLPSPVRPDPLLDPFERATLGRTHPAIEDVRAAARREEMSFWAMLQSAGGRITLSYPKLLGRNETLPSPYLERLGLQAADAPRSPICSWRELRRVALPEGRETYGDGLLVQARHAHDIELRRESEAPPGSHDGVTEIAYQEPAGGIGVSRLIDMASCPFKFWAKAVLRLEEPAEAPSEFDYALRGTLYHEALHRAVEMAMSEVESGAESDADRSGDLRAAALEHLAAAFAEAEAALEADRDVRLSAFPNWERDRDEHITVLRNAIQGQDFVQPDTQVLALERRFQGWWRDIRVRGRIDRVDHSSTGAVLIDYKSGASVSGKAKDAAGKATVDLQLPVYREGATELLEELVQARTRSVEPGSADAMSPQPTVRDTFYYSVTKAKKISVADAPEAELSRIAQDVRAGWQAGAFPVDPDVDWSACRYCEFDALCRKGPRLERKRRRE